jgi:hypothetical protein
MAQGSFLGLALIIAGAALFVRFSLARYLRFWMIRMTYESRANTDRVVDAIERAAGLDDASYAAAIQPTVEPVAPHQPPPPPPFQ